MPLANRAMSVRPPAAEPLRPGAADPNRPQDPAGLARRLRVPSALVRRWIEGGLPVEDGGLIDPMTAVDWLNQGRLGECPLLARRWQRWMDWFIARPRRRRLTAQRIQCLHLPVAAPVTWWIPEPADGANQRHLSSLWAAGEADGRWRRLTWEVPVAEPRAEAESLIELLPGTVEPRDRPGLERLVAAVVADFRYVYRRHDADLAPRSAGTCLDLAVQVGAALAGAGRRWRLVGGVVAHNLLANLHAWVEVEDPAGWVPVDATPLAVARMLGRDWRVLLPGAIGRHDARCIRLGHAGEGGGTLPAAAPYGGIFGDALVTVAGGQRPAWPCADWAVGGCAWRFAAG